MALTTNGCEVIPAVAADCSNAALFTIFECKERLYRKMKVEQERKKEEMNGRKEKLVVHVNVYRITSNCVQNHSASVIIFTGFAVQLVLNSSIVLFHSLSSQIHNLRTTHVGRARH